MKKFLKKIKTFFVKKKDLKVFKVSCREFLPNDFLFLAFNHIIYNKGAFKYKNGNWEVENCYFCGKTLCLDIKNGDLDFVDVITICSDNTFGFFTHFDIYQRSELFQNEIDRLNIIRNNIKLSKDEKII